MESSTLEPTTCHMYSQSFSSIPKGKAVGFHEGHFRLALLRVWPENTLVYQSSQEAEDVKTSHSSHNKGPAMEIPKPGFEPKLCRVL